MAPAGGVVWDTMSASALRPEPGGVWEAIRALRDTPEEVFLAAPTVEEVLYGMWRVAPRRADFVTLATWWASRVLSPDGLRVLVPDAASLVAAARVRARCPLPPAAGRRRATGEGTPDRRVAWVADIQIAVIGWRFGLPVVTRNRGDFETVGALLDDIYPGQPPLRLEGPPL